MRKISFVLVVLSYFMTLSTFARQPPDWDKVEVKVEKLSGNVYMLQFVAASGGNAGANASAFVGDDGIA
jgi:hypothetical protein